MEPVAKLDFAELHDADHLDQLLDDWSIHSTQLDCGRHRLINERVIFSDLVVERNWANVRKLDEYCIPESSTVFAFVKPGTPPAHWCGFEIPDDVVLLNQSSREHFAILPADHETVTLLIPNELIAEWGLLPESLIDDRSASKRAIIPLVEPEAARFRNWLFSNLASRRKLRGLTGDDGVATEFYEQLFYGLSRLLDEGLAARDGSHQRCHPVQRFSLVRRACSLVTDRICESLSVPELAIDLGVSRRTLERGFVEVLGVTPQVFVRVSKLNSARRELRQTARHATSVSQVALKYGFTELGRFSVRYRQLFGESPSETLCSGTRVFGAQT